MRHALLSLDRILSTLDVVATTTYAALGSLLHFDAVETQFRDIRTIVRSWLTSLASGGNGQAMAATAVTAVTDLKLIPVDIKSMTTNLCVHIQGDSSANKLPSVWSETECHNLSKLVAQVDSLLTPAKELRKTFQYGPKYQRASCSSCIAM